MSLFSNLRALNLDLFRFKSILLLFCQNRSFSMVVILLLTHTILYHIILFHSTVSHYIFNCLFTFCLIWVFQFTYWNYFTCFLYNIFNLSVSSFKSLINIFKFEFIKLFLKTLTFYLNLVYPEFHFTFVHINY